MKPTFLSDDNKSYETEAEALARNKFLEKRREFDDAWVALFSATRSEYKTADGYLLSDPPSSWSDFYYIRGGHWNAPTIQQISIYWRSISHFGVSDDDMTITLNESIDGNRERTPIQLSQLYAVKANAEARAIEIIKQQIEWLQEDVAKLQKEQPK